MLKTSLFLVTIGLYMYRKRLGETRTYTIIALILAIIFVIMGVET